MRCSPFLVALTVMLLGSAGAAQQPRLHESVVVTAAGEPIPFENVARDVWVLTREQIARLPVQSLDELLRLAATIDVRARGPQGVQADLSIRGGSFGQTLVLVDGVRMNDAQSGHHNLDVPLTLADIERIEVLAGPGSSLFGADALGGTINVITREAGRRLEAEVSGGEHGLAAGRLRAGMQRGVIQQAIAVEGSRSSGFTADRDFGIVTASARTTIGRDTRLLAGHVRKDFGASGFYGPAPSREWTDQTILGLTRGFALEGWRSTLQAMYRSHGDRFLYDPRVPGAAANVHRTHAATVVFRAGRPLGRRTRANAGMEAGADWIASSNLGDRSFRRASGFAELQHRIGNRATVYPGLRFDAYSRFGSAWSPSLAGRVALTPVLALRASAGRAFRVPTFTELYYRDPNHLASDDLRPERAWGGEAGVDWIAGPRTQVRATAFARREHDVIDWTRLVSTERWRTMNVRGVSTNGLELGVRQLLAGSGWLDVHYLRLSTSAGALDGLQSKYVLEYAPHAVAASASVRLPFGIDAGQRAAWVWRNDGRSYAVADVRVARRFGRVSPFVNVSNLFDERYEEVKGVAMPGRWIVAGLNVGVARP